MSVVDPGPHCGRCETWDPAAPVPDPGVCGCTDVCTCRRSTAERLDALYPEELMDDSTGGVPASATWEPCCPRCRRGLADVPDDTDPAVLGTCPVHGDVQAGAEWWGEPISEEAHRLASGGAQ